MTYATQTNTSGVSVDLRIKSAQNTRQGMDTFVFGRRGGSDRIKGFQNGKDKIEIDSGANSFAQVKVTDKAKNTLLEFAGTKVLLLNFDHKLIDASDFLFT